VRQWQGWEQSTCSTESTYPVKREAPLLLPVVDKALQLVFVLGKMDAHRLGKLTMSRLKI